MRPLDHVLDALEGVIRRGNDQYMARCPAHEDRTASLTLAEGDDGRVIMRCWAGCDTKAVVDAAGLQWSDLFPPRSRAERQRYQRERRTLAGYRELADCLLVVMLDCGVGPLDPPYRANPRRPDRDPLARKRALQAVEMIRRMHGLAARHPGRALSRGEGRALLVEVAGLRRIITHRLDWMQGGIAVYDGDHLAYTWRCPDRARCLRADDREIAAATRVAVGLLAVYGG